MVSTVVLACSLTTPTPASPVTALMTGTLATVQQTVECVSASHSSEDLKTVLCVPRVIMITTVNHVPAFLMEQGLTRMEFHTAPVEMTCSAPARRILEELFAMSVLRDITTFQSVLLVSVIPRHQRAKFVTQNLVNAGVK